MKMLEDLAEVVWIIDFAETWECTGDQMRCLDGNGCECEIQGKYRPDAEGDAIDFIKRHHATIADMAKRLEAAERGWQTIDTAPKGKPILVHYMNSGGKGRTVKAYYIERFTEEASSDSENDEYNEVDDTYYTLPGWYEMIDNWEDYSAVAIHSDPTHWMPLPAPPTDRRTPEGE